MSARRLACVVAALLTTALVVAPYASAHALQGRDDLPIPDWLFGWAAAAVLVVSFLGFALVWREPKLEAEHWRPLPRRISRVLCSTAIEVACGVVGVGLLGLTVWSGLAGARSPTSNFAPTFVFVVFWLGLVAVSLFFGDVYRAFNPWRAIGRASAWVAQRFSRSPLPAPFPYPAWLGRWPAAAGLFAFAWMELVAPGGADPRTVAIAVVVYSVVNFLGMLTYGVDRWIDRAEAFSVYFGLFARISPVERRDDQIGLRRPLSGLTGLEPLPGTVGVLAVMIGATSFDGLGEGAFWEGLAPEIQGFFTGLGLGDSVANELAYGVGLTACVVFVLAFYLLGIESVRRISGASRADQLATSFVHSLVPIALAYVAAHYVTLLIFQGQAIAALASDPLGRGWNLFGTAEWKVDYTLIGATTAWYLQVAFVIVGHVAALALAHDRAIAIYSDSRAAIRSQYLMLVIMIGFTTFALWLLSESYI